MSDRTEAEEWRYKGVLTFMFGTATNILYSLYSFITGFDSIFEIIVPFVVIEVGILMVTVWLFDLATDAEEERKEAEQRRKLEELESRVEELEEKEEASENE